MPSETPVNIPADTNDARVQFDEYTAYIRNDLLFLEGAIAMLNEDQRRHLIKRIDNIRANLNILDAVIDDLTSEE